MKFYSMILWVTLLAWQGYSQIVINEVDADTPDTDVAEFMELYGPPNQALDGMVVVFYNGNGDESYAAFDLDGYSLNSEGFFVICGSSTNVVNCDLDANVADNFIQNGADAIALYSGNAADFPNGSPISTLNLIDALVYDTNDSDDLALLVLTPGQAQINESANGNSANESNSRVPDGGAALQTGSYSQKIPTPGASNVGGATSTVVINEFVANHTGNDLYEYLELSGDPNRDYSSLTIVQLEGDLDQNPGTIDTVYPVETTDENGIWFSGYLDNELGGGTKSLLLVEGYSGSLGIDLDTDDNGVLDQTAWSNILDDVATNDGDAGDLTYTTTVLGVEYDGLAFSPGGASRIPNGIDTNTSTDWVRNNFYGAGLPGYPISLPENEALNTPGYPNTTLKPPVINEFVADHVGVDTHEFVEILGQPLEDYSLYWVLVVGGDAGNTGDILQVFQAGTTSLSGTLSQTFNDELPNGSLSFLLVNGFQGSQFDDLDADDDGALDSKPWVVLVDDVAIHDGGVDDLVYSETVLLSGFDGTIGHPGGASRIPNGLDSNQATDWMRNDFDGAGLPSMTGTLVSGEAYNTPDAVNSQFSPGGTDLVINEWVANHTGVDDHEFVEIFGTPDTNYTHCWLLAIDGDTVGNPGQIERILQVGETGPNGFWWSGFLTEQFENTSLTFLLVDSFTGSLSQDLDTNNDGSFDLAPWSQIIDSIGINNEVSGDVIYSAVVLNKNYDGGFYTVAGASRLPNGIDTDQASDWTRNDFEGKGLPGFSGAIDPGEAFNTPGTFNSDSGTGAQLTEFVFHHDGGDTHEFVEIHGDPSTNYSTSSVLIIEGDLAENPGQIDQIIPCGATNGGGFWASDYFDSQLENGSQSLFVVEQFSGSLGDDLDSDDDGVLDSEPWTVLSDAVSYFDEDAGDLLYASSVLSASASPLAQIGGASRFPYGQDTDTAEDWVVNDFSGEGLPGFVGTLDLHEAFNTPGLVNRIFIQDYYSSVDDSSDLQLRMSLHEIIRNHVRFNYSADSTDTWDILEDADEDPLNSANILSVYRNRTFAKVGGGNDFYNREHTWPKSYGFPDDSIENYPYTDCHHLMLSDSGYNSDRSNIVYGDCSASCSERPTDDYNGQGGGTGSYPGNSNWFSGSGNAGSFEVWNERRGDVARALLYLDVRYEGGTHSFTGFNEPDLVLTDDTNLIHTFSDNTTGIAYMGRLMVLLQWHLDDPVDDMERLRNEIVSAYQGNRNPFVDHPEWVDCVFLGICDGPCHLGLLPDWQDTPSSCGTGVTTVLDFVQVINGTCECW